jgi:hypothetical protein
LSLLLEMRQALRQASKQALKQASTRLLLLLLPRDVAHTSIAG